MVSAKNRSGTFHRRATYRPEGELILYPQVRQNIKHLQSHGIHLQKQRKTLNTPAVRWQRYSAGSHWS